MYTYPIALTIATSDSGGGAGIQADLKTFSALGVFGTSVLCALTAQNTMTVSGIMPVEADFVTKQLQAVLSDFDVKAIKIGMIYTPANAKAISEQLPKCVPVILDPVMISTSGCSLIEDDTAKAMEKYLFPLATLLTPNISEAQALCSIKIKTIEDMQKAAHIFVDQKGLNAVLVKGGHLEGNTMADILYIKGDNETQIIKSQKIKSNNTHGTGCTLSSAIAAYMAIGFTLAHSVKKAKEYITQAIKEGNDVQIGHSHGPVNHFFCPQILIKR